MTAQHVIPIEDSIAHRTSKGCSCHPLRKRIAKGVVLYIHNAADLREKWERQGIKTTKYWILIDEP